MIDTELFLNMKIDKEEIYWEQKACANWLKLGDRNIYIYFFHRFASQQWKTNQIRGLRGLDDQLVTTKEDLDKIAKRVLLRIIYHQFWRELNETFPTTWIKSSRRNIVWRRFLWLWRIWPNKSIEFKWFTRPIFFPRYWHIVASVVGQFYLDVLNRGTSLAFVNSTQTVLIPKTEHLDNIPKWFLRQLQIALKKC